MRSMNITVIQITSMNVIKMSTMNTINWVHDLCKAIEKEFQSS